MAKRQSPAQRRASLRNLKKARAARKGPVRKRRRRNPPVARRASPKKRRSTAWRTKAPARRRYRYSSTRRRVVRTNQPKVFRGIVPKLMKAGTDAGWALIGKGTVNYVSSMLPFPRDGMMGTGVKLLTAFTVTAFARNFKVVGPNGAHMMLVGSLMGMVEPFVKLIPIIGPALGEDLPLGAYLGEYGGGDMGAYVEPEVMGMGEELPLGEYMFV